MDFKDIVTIVFQQKNRWKSVSQEEKEKVFFIFNRYMAKKYPKLAQHVNNKNMDRSIAMDIWFEYLRKETGYPGWFWKGPTKKKDPPIKEWETLRDFWKMDLKDIYLVCEWFPKETKKEIERIKEITKEQEK